MTDPRDIAAGLSRVLGATHRMVDLTLDIPTARLILFSDQHRGTRDQADDFRRCEPAYNAALAWYYDAGFTLCAMGDVEELWENRPARVAAAYRNTLGLEARFHAEGRYFRLWGNHDDDWMDPGRTARHLHPWFPGLEVCEGIRVEFRDQGVLQGTALIVHGHQGTAMSDRHRGVARWVVRNVWRHVQRVTGWRTTTPARDLELRQAHDMAMAEWANRMNDGIRRFILFTGHTHRPVFMARRHLEQVALELSAAEMRLAGAPGDPDALRRRRELRAEYEWVRAKDSPDHDAPGPAPPIRPCYFNTGCCVFSDGDITGIEIADGEVRLVRWPDDAGYPLPKVLARERLTTILEAL